MLTSVFYYNLYRPYLVGGVNGRNNEVSSPRRERINTNRESGEPSGRVFVLNKSLREDVVNHAQAVTTGVTDLRSATGRTAYDMENFNRYVHREGWDEAIGNLANNLERFANGFNRSAHFMQDQEHSANLRAFSDEIIENVEYNSGRLEMLGLGLSEGRLSFNREQVEAMSYEQVNVAIGENIEIFEGLRAYTNQLLSEPLAEHMRFRGLTYHYNYQMGRMETEGFNLIEAGMLVDRLV